MGPLLTNWAKASNRAIEMGYRRLAREAALSFLYQSDLGLESMTLDPQSFARHFYPEDRLGDLFLRIVLGVQADQKEVDAAIQAVSEHWKLGRMERIDRVILRLATWEIMKEHETPVRVVIDEAVEIAKKFSTVESAGFVNGLLDQIAKKHRQTEDLPKPTGVVA